MLRQLRELAPKLPITVCTSAPADLFSDAVAPPLAFREIEVDVGLVQKDALTIDEAASAEAIGRFVSRLAGARRVRGPWLRPGASPVLGDIPPLAFAPASAAGLRSVALGNFSWDWIYAIYSSRDPLLLASRRARRPRLPRGLLCGCLSRAIWLGLPRIEDIPLVDAPARTSRRQKARRRLSLDGRDRRCC